MKISTLLYLLTIIAQVSLADDKTVAKSHKEISQFFTQYLNNYNNYLNDISPSDALKMSAEDFNIPAMQVPQKGPVQIIASQNQIKNNTHAFLDNLRDNGVNKIAWKKIQIKELSFNAAVASNIAILYKSDGSVYTEIAATYILHKSAKDWKLAARALHPVNHALRVY